MICEDDYNFIVELVEKFTGIALGSSSQYLVDARLSALARDLGYKDIRDILDELKAKPVYSQLNNDLVCAVLDAMTTNESLFFRDEKPFQIFENYILPSLQQKNRHTKNIRIWSAACSTGQEPYSMAMVINENKDKLQDWKIEILATDICRKALDRAKSGVFSLLEVQRGLSPYFLDKYFEQEGNAYRVKSSLKENIEFKQLNLIEDRFNEGRFDLIFCRNVLIYFKPELKAKVLQNLSQSMSEGSYLVLGGAESASGINDVFKRVNDVDGMLFINKSQNVGAA